MQNVALVYLVARFFYRIFDFFHHWYVHGLRAILHGGVNFFEHLDRVIALRMTVRYFFEPLYKDYTFVGRILGVIFRSVRICIGLAVYAFFGFFLLLLCLAWVAFPILVAFSMFRR